MSSDSESDTKGAAAATEEITDLSNPDVVAKYKLAATIANTAVQGILTQLTPGKKVVELCEFGDVIIERQCAATFKSKKVTKGVAFPTCVSLNETVCHYSPFASESIELKEGDTVKIDLGCHIDGYIAVVAHTAVVGASDAPITGKQADVFLATLTAAEAALRTIKAGNTNTQVTAVINQVAEAYGVTPITGTFSHQMKQFIIDGNKIIVQREEPDKKVPEVTFETNEVYAIDIAFSSGDGKPRDTDVRTTVLKRVVDREYQLKMKASRYVISEVNHKFPTMPFTLRSLDERQARMGVVECVKHGLLAQYPVVAEKEGSFVAHFKFTVLVTPTGPVKITGLPLPASIVSDKSPPASLLSLLATSTSAKKKKNKKKKAAGAAAAAAGGAEAEADDGDDE